MLPKKAGQSEEIVCVVSVTPSHAQVFECSDLEKYPKIWCLDIEMRVFLFF